MKKITRILVVLGYTVTLAASVNLTSCVSKDPARPEFAVIEKAETLRAEGVSFELDYRFKYISWYSDDHVFRKIQAAMTSDFFGVEFLRANPMESSLAFNEHVADIFGKRSAGDEELRWNGFMKIRSWADVLSDRIVCYTIERADYTGGAHGMETTDCINYDLRTGDRMTVDDLFTPEGKVALSGVIRQRILKDHHKATWAELMEEYCFFEESGVVPIDNFQLSGTHITFIYNPYSIACYAGGSTKVKLPLGELAGFKREAHEK